MIEFSFSINRFQQLSLQLIIYDSIYIYNNKKKKSKDDEMIYIKFVRNKTSQTFIKT